MLFFKLHLFLAEKLFQVHWDVVHDEEEGIEGLLVMLDWHDDVVKLHREKVVFHHCQLAEDGDLPHHQFRHVWVLENLLHVLDGVVLPWGLLQTTVHRAEAALADLGDLSEIQWKELEWISVFIDFIHSKSIKY